MAHDLRPRTDDVEAEHHNRRRDDAVSGPASLPATMLRLQQSAGNRGVAAMVHARTVQRHAPGPTDGPAKPIGEPAVRQIIGQGIAAGGAGATEVEDHAAVGPEQAPAAEETAAADTAMPSPAPQPASPGGGLFNQIGGFFRRAASAVGSAARSAGRAASGAASAVARGVGSVFSRVGGAVRSAATAVSGAVRSAATAVSAAVRRAIAKSRITIDIRAHGSATGTTQARSYIDEIFESSSLANLEAMAGKTIEFHIIPVGTKLTDLTEFASLAGTTTFDGRLWDDVRGIWMGAGPTTIRFAVGAEDLGAGGSGYGPGFVAAHEGGHGLQNHGLTATQSTAITAAYAARLAAHPVTQATDAGDAAQAFWLQPQWYSAANENEYFASSVAAWFGHAYSTDATSTARYTRAWLETNDAPMHAVLSSIYGA